MRSNKTLDIARILSERRDIDAKKATPPSFESFLQYKAKAQALAEMAPSKPNFLRILLPAGFGVCAAVSAFLIFATQPVHYRMVPLTDREFTQVPIDRKNGTLSVRTSDKRVCIAGRKTGVISLGADSSLAIVPASGNAGERISLEKGACAFAVVKQQKPLSVTAHVGSRPVSISVLGTRFTVERSSSSVTVTLAEGTLSVTGGSNGVILTSGDRLTIDEKNYAALFGDTPLQTKAKFIAGGASPASLSNYFIPEVEQLPEMASARTVTTPAAEHPQVRPWTVPLERIPIAVAALSTEDAALVYEDGVIERISENARAAVKLPAPVSSRPAVFARGLRYIIVNANDDMTYMIDADSMRIAGSLSTGTLRNSGIVRRGDEFCAVNSDGMLVIFSLYRVLYRERILDLNFSDIAVHGDHLYAVSPGGTLVAYDLTARSVIWRKLLSGRFIEARLNASGVGIVLQNESRTIGFSIDGTQLMDAKMVPHEEFSDSTHGVTFKYLDSNLHRSYKQ